MKEYFLPIVLISSFLDTAVSAQIFRGEGSSGTAYPSGTPTKGDGFCCSSAGNNSSLGVGQAVHLALLGQRE